MTIIKLKDCSIENIDTDMTCYSEGCETCGYGSDYCTEVTVEFDDYTSINAEYHSEYNYDDNFSIGYFVRLFCQNFEKIQNMTKDTFIEWFKNTVSEDFYNDVKFSCLQQI